jgi:glyoxalase family protein
MKLQSQGMHHITFVGSNRAATIEFYQDLLGMPLVFEQPNLDVPEETHLYFDMGDGRLLTFFVRPTRTNDPTPNPEGIGNLHHLAFAVSHATYTQVAQQLNERKIWNTGPIDRGFMDSIYFRDPNGQLLEMACYKFVPPQGSTIADVLGVAHRLRIQAGDYAIAEKHLAEAIVELTERHMPTLENA